MPRSQPRSPPPATSIATAPSRQRAVAVEAFAIAVLGLGAAAARVHAGASSHLGVSAGDLAVLDLLVRRGHLTAGEIGASTGLASASVTGLIDRLEAARLVRRTADPADGRRVLVAVTGRGRRRIADAFRATGFDAASLAATLTDEELDRAAELMERVAAQLRSAVEESP